MITRILHISDLHIGRNRDNIIEANNLDLIVKYILKRAESDWQKKDDKPLIMLTGDIANDGVASQFERARCYFDQLANAGFTLRIIPGNHDYGKNGNDANEESFNLFKDYFGHFHKMEYPLCGPLNNHFLVGLNSMEVFTASNFAEGRLGERQIDKVCEFLEETNRKRSPQQKIIVYLHHHPFLFPDDGLFRRMGEYFGHRLEDGRDFMAKIKELKVDMLLFGHEHRHLNFSGTKLNKRFNIPHILSSGKSTGPGREFNVLNNGSTDKPYPIIGTYESDITDDSGVTDMEDYWDMEERIRKENQEKLDKFPLGLFGRLIDINDNGNINVNTINFLSS